MFFTTHLAPKIIIGLTIASGVLLNPNILRDNIPLSYKLHQELVAWCDQHNPYAQNADVQRLYDT